MASDGAALEDDVVTALSRLLERHRQAKKAPGTIAHGVLDVVNLSLGYYHETPEDADDIALVGRLSERIRLRIQEELDDLVLARKSVWFG